jgi:excisionase family DNA binding protein
MPTANSVAREWITIQEAADYLGLSERSVRAMIADGRLRGYRNGRRVIRLDRNEIDAAMRPFGGAA